MMQLGHPELRPGWKHSLAAGLLGIATGTIITGTASVDEALVNQVTLLGLILFGAGLLGGAPRLVGFSSVFVLGAALIESGFGEGANWTRAMVIGSLWYVTVELAWDGIARRDGSERTSAVDAKRLQEVTTVVVLAVVVGAVAAIGASIAPVRSLALQAVVIAGLLGAFVLAVRDVRAASESDSSPTQPS